MKLSMSMSSSKSTVRMYLISDPLGVSYVSPSGNSAFRRLSESKPLKRVHSTIELPVTRTHCESSMERLPRNSPGIINSWTLWPPTAVVAAFLRIGVGVSPFSLQSLWGGRRCSQSRGLRTSSFHTLYRHSPPYEGELRPAIWRQVREAVLHG